MIEFKDVAFQYEQGSSKGKIENINLTIHDGEVVLICGESGCGKTTLTSFNSLIDLISKLEDGSSSTNISGSIAETDAQATFCFSPPDSANKLLFSKSSIFNAPTVFSIRELISSASIAKFSHPNAISLVVSTVKNCVLGF